MLLLFIQNKYFPDYLWARYLKQCSSIKKTVFLLSFDCDTELDIEVLPQVVAKLQGIGIKPVLAVPGELIEKGQEVYKQFAASGIEFINHGYVQHTHLQLPERIYKSNFFYHKLSRDQISQDINKGHEAIRKHLEITPAGFRTPILVVFKKAPNCSSYGNYYEIWGTNFLHPLHQGEESKKDHFGRNRSLNYP